MAELCFFVQEFKVVDPSKNSSFHAMCVMECMVDRELRLLQEELEEHDADAGSIKLVEVRRAHLKDAMMLAKDAVCFALNLDPENRVEAPDLHFAAYKNFSVHQERAGFDEDGHGILVRKAARSPGVGGPSVEVSVTSQRPDVAAMLRKIAQMLDDSAPEYWAMGNGDTAWRPTQQRD